MRGAVRDGSGDSSREYVCRKWTVPDRARPLSLRAAWSQTRVLGHPHLRECTPSRPIRMPPGQVDTPAGSMARHVIGASFAPAGG